MGHMHILVYVRICMFSISPVPGRPVPAGAGLVRPFSTQEPYPPAHLYFTELHTYRLTLPPHPLASPPIPQNYTASRILHKPIHTTMNLSLYQLYTVHYTHALPI